MSENERAPSGAAEAEVPRVEVRNLAKRYGSVHALRDVNMKLNAGEIVGLVGDNGAGKSTLVNLISGALQPTAGQILVDGRPVSDALTSLAGGASALPAGGRPGREVVTVTRPGRPPAHPAPC